MYGELNGHVIEVQDGGLLLLLLLLCSVLVCGQQCSCVLAVICQSRVNMPAKPVVSTDTVAVLLLCFLNSISVDCGGRKPCRHSCDTISQNHYW